jgi:hypothetical protein
MLIISCNQHNSSVDKKIEKTQYDIKISDNVDIYGKWTMCSVFGNGIITQYNVCPKVFFNSNGSGSVGDNLITGEYFNWTLKNGTLTIKHTNKISNVTFRDSIYSVIINKHDKNKDLTITQPQKDYIYYLSMYDK